MTKPYATEETTERFFTFHPIHADKIRRLDDLYVSSIGLGTYLGDADQRSDTMYLKSLMTAVTHGVNFIDTAINYRLQRSEKLIGKAIKELSVMGITRDQLVIATKGGYVPPGNEGDVLQHIKSYLDKGIINKEDVVDDCHCIAPQFLQNQIDHSLHNMDLESIDLYYLHNPEVQLFEIPENTFEERLFEALLLLEENVKAGKIRRYGIATWNGFRQKANSKGLLQLRKILDMAEKIAGSDHHLKAIQIPYNLVMLEAHKIANQEVNEEYHSIFHAAKKYQISLVVSAPLMQQKVLHLPNRVFDALPAEENKQKQALQFVLSSIPVCSAMLGMKNPTHAKENIEILQQEDWKEQKWSAVRSFLKL